LRRIGLFGFACLALLAPRAAGAQPFGWLLPAGGETWTAGTQHTVEWNGGNPSWSVLVNAIRLVPFQAADAIEASTPNDGFSFWAIPPGLAPGGYLLYVQDTAASTWAYGPAFNIQAGPQCAVGCQQVSVSMPYYEPPVGVCGQTAADAEAAARAYSLQQLADACPNGYSIDPSSIVTDVTILPIGVCMSGYSGAFVAEASSVACCCPSPVPASPSSWGKVKSTYR
jgi:hypothetical protein